MCTKCPLNNRIKLQGRGSKNPSIVFVGESPDIDDVRYNKVFSGQKFLLLQKFLNIAKIPLDICYFINLCRCRVSDHNNKEKEPSALILKNCSKNFEDELKSLNSKIIVPIGKIPIKKFLGTKYNESNSEGIPFRYKNNSFIVPIYDLKTIMENPNLIPITEMTFQRIREWLVTDPFSKWTHPKFNILKNENDILKFIDLFYNKSEWACDIETGGLDLKDDIYSLSFSDEVDVFGFALRDPEGYPIYNREITNLIWEKIRNLFLNDSKKIFHGNFDLMMMLKHNVVCKNLYCDTSILSHLYNSNLKNHKLKYIIWKILGMGGYESEYLSSSDDRTSKGVPTDILLKYNCSDAYVTFLLYKKLYKKVEEEFPFLINMMHKLVLPFSLILSETKYVGIKIDVEYIKELMKKYEKEMNVLYSAMKKIVGRDFNVRSGDELIKIIYKELKCPVVDKTASGKPSTDVDALSKIKNNDFINYLLQYKKLDKINGTYLTSFLELKDENDCVHSTYSIIGTKTGRLSSSNPNCQNIIRNNEIKNMFVSRPGNFFIDVDFSQAEYRWWAHYSKDEKMINDIESGVDILKIIASKVFKVPIDSVTDLQRKIAKFTVYGTMYGRGAKSIAMEHGISEEEARNIIKYLFSQYPKASLWLKMIVKQAHQYGYIKNFFGRVLRYPGLKSNDSNLVAKSERDVKNNMLQSSVSDYVGFRAVLVNEPIKSVGGNLVMTVHDSLVYEVPEINAENALIIIFKYFSKPLKNVLVRLDFKCEVGYKLGDMIEINNPHEVVDALNKLKNLNKNE